MPIPEIVNRGAKLSPIEDFRLRTLSALSGLWNKLLYIAELRSEDGKYHHWGHIRTHGEAASQAALAALHSELYLAALRTPISELMQQGGSTANEAHGGTAIAWTKIETSGLIPDDLAGGSPRQFNSVVLALRLLNDDQRTSTRSTASQLQLPVQ